MYLDDLDVQGFVLWWLICVSMSAVSNSRISKKNVLAFQMVHYMEKIIGEIPFLGHIWILNKVYCMFDF